MPARVRLGIYVPLQTHDLVWRASCVGRMAEGAALLVDHVLPAVGYRQWTLSFQGPKAVRLDDDTDLLVVVRDRPGAAEDGATR